ncbi:hypothetical protein [Arthrobacter sp. ISL-72]|uniref:hypothetical protein n=1 Tax=Arthrobacter sp. ISL-72 TaxID=2819114 RepID=UPI001BE556D7|nr:hypothetical protein [Arthrobacter sp. ISL-72]MBT2597238.1 hypothetical protein [Arthrobacter sp. ISL-72]
MKANIRRPRALGLAATAAVLALSACGSPGMSGPGTASTTAQTTSAPTTTAPAPAPPAESVAGAPAEILIKGFKYQGDDTVSSGAEITVNEDTEARTITADTGTAFDAIIKVGTGTFRPQPNHGPTPTTASSTATCTVASP